MHTSFARRVVLGVIVSGILAVAPSVASAATTYATISNECWLREYPDTVTCDNGWVGVLGLGATGLGESYSFFDADFNVPTGAEVTEATLRFNSPYTMTSEAQIGEVTGGLDRDTTTWATFDSADINTFKYFTPGVYGIKEVDVTDAVQDFLANSQSGATLGVYASSPTDYTYLDDLEIEIEYDL